MNSKDIRFKLFTNCVLVDGNVESLIYDLGRQSSYPIANSFASILQELENLNMKDFKKKYEHLGIDEFINQFIEEELAFFTNNHLSFPDLNLEWDSPYLITNAILQVDESNGFNLRRIIQQISDIGCQAVELRIEYDIQPHQISEILSYFKHTRIDCIDFYIPSNKSLSKQFFFDLILLHPRIRFLYNYSSSKDEVILSDDVLFDGKIIYSTKNILTDHTEVIQTQKFVFNVQSFSEAQNHNLGLNRKVSINKNGVVKNYLTHSESYGIVDQNNLLEIIKSEKFQEKWSISNSKIEKCKDCQYRFCCVSNSDIYSEENKLYKSSTCNFDPYSNKWN